MSDAELVNREGEAIRKGRISPALRTAITLIVSEGLTIADAALRTGYKAHSLTQALKKPHVRAYRASVKRAWLSSQTEQSWRTAADLVVNAASEDVRLKAARIFIDADLDAMRTTPGHAGQLVQIVTQNVNMGAQLPHGQLSGVIEALPYQPFGHEASNSQPVGRDEIEGDADE